MSMITEHTNSSEVLLKTGPDGGVEGGEGGDEENEKGPRQQERPRKEQHSRR